MDTTRSHRGPPGNTECANCSAVAVEFTSNSLMCSDLCRDEAKYVRYHRKAIKTGAIRQPVVREAIKVKRAHLLSGGYPERARDLSPALRSRIPSRDKACRRCGQYATEVDHVRGSSNKEANLQGLCHDCHRKKTLAALRPFDPDKSPDKAAKARELTRRVHAERPEKTSDDEEEWEEFRRNVVHGRHLVSLRGQDVRVVGTPAPNVLAVLWTGEACQKARS